MIDLSANAGLPLSLDEDGQLVFGRGLTPVAPAVRRKNDMREVLMEPDSRGPEELYYMYRNVMQDGDGGKIRAAGLRYDITVIKPGILGKEFIKTAGHYHPEKKGTGITYPEVYEVISGVAHYLLQELIPGEDKVRRVALLEARAGSRVMMPANYGHITINPGNSYLVMANWVAEEFASEYGQFKEKKGGAYYEVAAGEDTEFIPNPLYDPIPPLAEWQVVEAPELNLTRERPFYRSFLENPAGFRYLVEPENHREDFARYVEKAAAGK